MSALHQATAFAGISTSYPALIHALVPPVTFNRFLNPNGCIKLVAALERYPPAQITAVSRVGSNFKAGKLALRFESGAVAARGACPDSYSPGRRTSTICRSDRAEIR